MAAQNFDPLFISYVRSGDVESAKKFLSIHQIDLNKVIQKRQSSSGTEFTYTPLMLAYKRGHLKMMELLLIEGRADVDFLTSSYPARSALMLAVEDRKMNVVNLLIRLGAQVTDATGSGRECALTIACKQGDLEIVKALLPTGPKGANLSEAKWASGSFSMVGYDECSCDMSPVNIAAEQGHLELLTWLLEGGAEIPANSLHLAIWKRKDCTPAMVELLLKHGAMVNETGKGVSPLMMASCYGYNEIVKKLLKKGADVDHKSEDQLHGPYFALWIAAMEGHTEVVETLLKGGANVNLKGNRDLSILQGVMDCHKMPEDKMVAILKLLLDGGAEGRHAILITTINRGRLEVLKLLLQKKDDLQINDEHEGRGYPLMVAIQSYQSTEMVKLLLDAGARVDLQDKDGKSPLMVTGNVAIAKILLSKGVSINDLAYNGWHALLYAMKGGNFELVEYLLEQGADLDLEADDGSTATSVLQNDYDLQVRNSPINIMLGTQDFLQDFRLGEGGGGGGGR